MTDASGPVRGPQPGGAPPPDPTADDWSAWLPDLGPSPSATTDATRAPDAPAAGTPRAPGTPGAPGPTPVPRSPHTPPAQLYPSAPPPPPPSPTGPGSKYLLPPSSAAGWWARAQPVPPAAVHTAPPTNLVLAVLALVVMFPLGLVAVLRAASVSTHWSAGRYQQAWIASRSARRWSVAAFLFVPAMVLMSMVVAGLTLMS